MTFLRQWLLGVTACALLVSLLERLCPAGAARQAARFTGGLLLLLAMLRPLADVNLNDLAAWEPGSYREAVARLELELAEKRDNAMSAGIAAETAAYIEDKAGQLGLAVRSEVTVSARGGVPLPERVTLYGPYSAALACAITEELGVPEERQIWIESGG